MKMIINCEQMDVK